MAGQIMECCRRQGLAIALGVGLMGGCADFQGFRFQKAPIPEDESPTRLQSVPAGDFFPVRKGSWWVMYKRNPPGPAPGTFAPWSTSSIESVVEGPDGATGSVRYTVRQSVGCVGSVNASCPPYADETISLHLVKDQDGKVWRRLPAGIPLRPPLLFTLPATLGEAVTAPPTISAASPESLIGETVQKSTIEPAIWTPVGEFKNCLKLESTVTTTNPALGIMTERLTFWLAKDVGIVKEIYSNSSLVIETALATYSVPPK